MSNDPKDVIPYVTMRVVTPDGMVRDYGDGYLGYAGGDMTGGDGIAAVHALDTTYRSGSNEGEDLIASDYALWGSRCPLSPARSKP